MAQIRETIELLTKIFVENGSSKQKAETFRQAKFNHRDAVKPMWQLLFELVYYCQYNRIDDVTIKAMTHLSQEEQIVLVKRELQQRGFHSRDFADLPLDGTFGSRELLLALGWIMCKENIVNKFMANCTSPLDDDTSSMYQLDEDKKSNIKLAETSDPADRVHQLLWLNNKLRLSLRTLQAIQNSKNLFKHKIQEATLGISVDGQRNHLSMLEVYMLRNPEALKKNLDLLEKDNDRLQNLLRWKDHEEIFWKWMESVLDAKLADVMKRAGGGDVESVPAVTVQRLLESRFSLQEAIIKYEAIVDHLESLWEEKSSEISEEELDSVLASLDLEISIQRANIALCSCENFVHNSQNNTPTRFVYEKKTPNQPTRNMPIDVLNNLEDASRIEDEIDALQSLVDQLENDVELKHEQFQEELQSVSAKFANSITIPPLPRKV